MDITERNKDLHHLVDLIEEGREFEIIDLFFDLHPADIADLIESLEEEKKKKLFAILNIETASDVILELDDQTREQILEDIPQKRLTEILDDMDSDDATDLVGDLPKEQAEVILRQINKKESEQVQKLLTYGEETAGGIMQTELASVQDDMTVEDAIGNIRSVGEKGEDIHYVFVTDKTNRLLGVLPLRKLILEGSDIKVSNIMDSDPISVKVNLDQEEVAKIFKKHDLVSLPVVGQDGILLGRITIDDVVDIMEEEASEDFLRMAGTDEEELVYGTQVFKISRLRLPWIMINLFGGLITGYLMWFFKMTLREVIALVPFIPLITGMGGNVGVQSSSIMVRGIATGKFGLTSLTTILFKEMRVALIMGTICGSTVGIIAFLWQGKASLGLVVGFALVIAMVIASSMGVLAPAFFQKMKIDPTIASSPLVTTTNDITGIIVYLGIATTFLRYL